jgi:hypothetical protein
MENKLLLMAAIIVGLCTLAYVTYEHPEIFSDLANSFGGKPPQ